MNELDDFCNRSSDNDREWGPFLFMRPAIHEPMNAVRVLSLAVLMGLPLGLLGGLLFKAFTHLSAWSFPAMFVLSLFTLLRFTFAAAWNRRAERLIPIPVRVRR